MQKCPFVMLAALDDHLAGAMILQGNFVIGNAAPLCASPDKAEIYLKIPFQAGQLLLRSRQCLVERACTMAKCGICNLSSPAVMTY